MYAHNMGGAELGKFSFRPGKALKRVAHITPKSFTVKRILGAVGSFTATVMTGGLGPIIAPKIVSANSKGMQILGGVTTAIAVAAGAVILGPAIAASLGPTLSSASGMLGKGVETLTGFFGAFNKLSPAQQQQQAGSLTAQQIADVEQGRATFDPNTGALTYGNQGAMPGSLMVQGQNVPLAPWQPSGSPASDFGPPTGQPGETTEPVQAGMLGGLSPIALGLMIGVPLLMQFLTKKGRN
jgi:hypothetical protein